ncbi:acyl-CoA carboxylase epsilon subunit [Nonomuraea candida]|uniref:acyl-CoA carboxylase epsilon subunit n=1 Tax=Nonomuraea candida TaxID=359159 RepID=UPI0005B9EA70|nr:acyl-CoA carboxylase epsilon subunit [Nonomuraea candida]
MTGPDTPPLLRVEKGNPSADDLAALVAVLLARAARAEPDGPRTPARAMARWHGPDRAPRFAGPRTWRNGER